MGCLERKEGKYTHTHTHRNEKEKFSEACSMVNAQAPLYKVADVIYN